MWLNKVTFEGKVILTIILGGAVYLVWQNYAASLEKHQQAVLLSQEQAAEINVLQNKLQMNAQNAELVADFIKRAQAGQVQPVNHFTVKAPDVSAAAQGVVERLNKNDITLPPQAIEQTDRTIVVPNSNKSPAANYDVGVFKINNYREWEWSIGYGQHGSDRYIPIQLQRNIDKDAAISVEYHIGGRENGVEVKYTRKVDKVFLLF